MIFFCTYFDHNYLLRGLTLYRSLRATGFDFTLHVLALDDHTRQTIVALGIPELRVVALEAIEASTPALLNTKKSRSRIEYYFTLTPFLPLHLLEQHPEIELITYLDADLYFYESPEPVLDELADRSILICEHRYSKHLSGKMEYGRYNVQFQGFRRDAAGLACLQRWRDQCLDWCYDRVEGERYADQKYLDEWPRLYGDRLAILEHKGGGVAPWNWATYPLKLQSGKVTVDNQPLVFYHFHGVKIFGPHFISNGLLDWGLMPLRLRYWFYGGYVRQIRATRNWLFKLTSVDILVKDVFIRGKRPGLASLGEIARKAWSQAMVIP